MENSRIFAFDRDWDAGKALMDQARILVAIRLEDGLNLRELFFAAVQGSMGLPKHTLAWLWFHALVLTIQSASIQVVTHEMDKTRDLAFLKA
ncbi:hypothetical protein F5Y06DRAFT_308397 [Hypoxylon sp. FL0890]|nr:hypothetical protein F5Y06DRAFT_308397 [Hypoxylon sp. FL0890]